MNPEVWMLGLFCEKCEQISSKKKCPRCGNKLRTVTFNLQTGLTKDGRYYSESLLREAIQAYTSRERNMELAHFNEES